MLGCKIIDIDFTTMTPKCIRKEKHICTERWKWKLKRFMSQVTLPDIYSKEFMLLRIITSSR